ncbi:hypothetical protein AWH56_016185 [Anaerobacillus isosaccharinicus]|uniref:Uncharacterized protein n=1 Tax=Anaerobacillus isosaccharinicus TaxID=1532552 RepID=A0A7S7R9Z3_9BACI|nr:hypothetical protein [Anaerobacillus isosaccharinicus]MBA5587560.1 hypothetical protein [Anaerobacillus isosaccharinicus]QOY34263.1 hypothetical protein AWH56_016185 [Anaerobacillus isosaccharinicus]
MLLQVTLFAVYTIIILWIMGFIYLFRNNISKMAGMMSSMTLGMVTGLSFGTITAVLHPDYFFQVTVISILFGGIVGTIAGLPIGLLALLDGLLSGIMGGMMGAMLGVMVASEWTNNIISVIVLFSGGILFILFLMMQNEVKIKLTGWQLIYGNPLPFFIIIVLSFYLTHNYTFSTPIEKHEHHSHYKEYHKDH